jgi:hypothetical protein
MPNQFGRLEIVLKTMKAFFNRVGSMLYVIQTTISNIIYSSTIENEKEFSI